MSNEVPDLRGDLVTVGDTIAYAATDGRSSGLRVGKVIEVVPPTWGFKSWKTPPKLRVEVVVTTGYGLPAKPTLIDASLKRFVKVND